MPFKITFKRAAVSSLLVVQHWFFVDDAWEERALGFPLSQLCSDDPTIMPHAGATLTGLVDDQLRGRFGRQVIALEEVRKAENEIRLDKEVDTLGSRAQKLAKLLEVDVVMTGAVWRYRDQHASGGVLSRKSTASVAFAIYLIEADTGHTVWSGRFDETQRLLFENLLEARKQIKMGLKWLTADELGRSASGRCSLIFPPTFSRATMRELCSENTRIED